jgi:hypothetical protein
MDGIIGAAIAIVSGTLAQFLNNILELKKEKKKLVFEKLQEIIISISLISEGLQTDCAAFFGIGNSSSKEMSFEINKLTCMVKIFHPALSNQIDKLVVCMNNYFEAKNNFFIVTVGNPTPEIRQTLSQNVSDKFVLFNNEIKNFITALGTYGNSKT